MFAFLTILAFSNVTFPMLKANNGFACMFRYIDKIINDGANKNEVYSCFSSTDFEESYGLYVNFASNEKIKLSEPFFDEDFAKFFNLQQSIRDVYPNIPFLSRYKDVFIKSRPFFEELGPDVCGVLSLDYKTVLGLYDYVLINEENDGIQFGKLFKKLKLSSAWVPQLSKIVSFFDANTQPLEVLMDGLNVKKEYSNYLKNMKGLQIPQRNDQRFCSVIKLIDAGSAVFDIANGFYKNFIMKYFNDFIMPLIKTYAIKPVNIFDKSIYERANSLVNAIVKLSKYPSMCSKPVDQLSQKEKQKCSTFEMLINLIAESLPLRLLDGEEGPLSINFDGLKDQASVFTQEEINLTSILINNFTIKENYVKYFFGSIANSTDSSKSYVDILDGTNLIFTEDSEMESRSYEDGDGFDDEKVNINYQKIINGLSNAIKFVDNLDDTSNFKSLFDYFGYGEYWEIFNLIMEQVNRDNTLCDNYIVSDILEIDVGECESMVNSVKQISELFSSAKQIMSLAKEPTLFILDCLSPVFKELNIRIASCLNNIHRFLIAPMVNLASDIDIPRKVDYTKVTKSTGSLLTKLFKFIDDITPTFLKKIPFIGDLFNKFSEKIIGFFTLFKDNSDIAKFIQFFIGGSSAITEMLTNMGKSFDKKMTGEQLGKSLKPTSFINVYETSRKVNEIDQFRFKNLANAITYDGSSSSAELLEDKMTINDIFPFKTIVQNSNELSSGLQNNQLNLNTVAKSLGTDKENVKQSMHSVVETALSPPSNAIFDSFVAAGYKKEYVRAYIEGIGLFARQVVNGELVKTKTNEYIKIKKGLSPGAIAAIVLGVILAVAIAVFLGVYFGIIRKRQQKSVADDSTLYATNDDSQNVPIMDSSLI